MLHAQLQLRQFYAMFRVYIPDEYNLQSGELTVLSEEDKGSLLPGLKVPVMKRAPAFPKLKCYQHDLFKATENFHTDNKPPIHHLFSKGIIKKDFVKVYSETCVKTRSGASTTVSTGESISGGKPARSWNRLRSDAACGCKEVQPPKLPAQTQSITDGNVLLGRFSRMNNPLTERRVFAFSKSSNSADPLGTTLPRIDSWKRAPRLPPIQEKGRDVTATYLERTLKRAEILRKGIRESDSGSLSPESDIRSDTDSIRSRSILNTFRSGISSVRRTTRRRIRLKDNTNTGLLAFP